MLLAEHDTENSFAALSSRVAYAVISGHVVSLMILPEDVSLNSTKPDSLQQHVANKVH